MRDADRQLVGFSFLVLLLALLGVLTGCATAPTDRKSVV